jgi:hypothetical protein
MNIIVTFPQSDGGLEGLKEKIEHSKDPNLETFWEFKRFPKKFAFGDRLYICCGGVIQGYFIYSDVDIPVLQGESTRAIIEDWTPVTTPIAYISFRGYQYLQYPVTKELKDAE